MLVAAAILFVLVFFPRGKARSPGLSAPETARALERTLPGETRYTCDGVENDGTIALESVDYFCAPADRNAYAPGYWVAVDEHGIVRTLSAG